MWNESKNGRKALFHFTLSQSGRNEEIYGKGNALLSLAHSQVTRWNKLSSFTLQIFSVETNSKWTHGNFNQNVKTVTSQDLNKWKESSRPFTRNGTDFVSRTDWEQFVTRLWEARNDSPLFARSLASLILRCLAVRFTVRRLGWVQGRVWKRCSSVNCVSFETRWHSWFTWSWGSMRKKYTIDG